MTSKVKKKATLTVRIKVTRKDGTVEYRDAPPREATKEEAEWLMSSPMTARKKLPIS